MTTTNNNDVYMEVQLDKITPETVAPNDNLFESLQLTGETVNVVYLTLDPEAEGMYRVLSGRRRVYALREMGIESVQAIVREVDNETFHIQSLIFNSGNPNYMGEAEHVAYLKENGKYTMEEIAAMVNLSESTVLSRYDLVTKLIPEFQEQLRDGRLKYSATIDLVKLPPHKQQELLAEKEEEGKVVTIKSAKGAFEDHKAEKAEEAFKDYTVEVPPVEEDSPDGGDNPVITPPVAIGDIAPLERKLPEDWGAGDPNLARPHTAGPGQEEEDETDPTVQYDDTPVDNSETMVEELLVLRGQLVGHQWGAKTTKGDKKFIATMQETLDTILEEYLI